jgi:Spy/CpxP family protein refolding chaperone
VNTWKVILATMLIFGTGVVTGGLLVRNSTRVPRPPQRNASIPRPPQTFSPAGVKIEFLRRMERDLNLTLEQRERIDNILSASQERTRKLMEPVSPQLREEFQQTKDEFRAVLTHEQRQAFDAMLKQQRPNQRHSPNRTSEAPLQAPPAAAKP